MRDRPYVVGSVPYANAIPLVAWFEELGDDSPVKVVYDIPSKLPALLDSGQADAILVSSIDALRVPGRRMAEGVCIGSHGPVKSVRLFSKVPPSYIRSIALDQSSMTSNRLAMIILSELHGASPQSVLAPPNQAEMLRDNDACLLIGDIGMTAPSEGLHVLDLGEQWQRLTNRPFVWAAWIGNESLTPELSLHLRTASLMSFAGRNLNEDASKARRELLASRRWYKPPSTTDFDAFKKNAREKIIKKGLSKASWTEAMLTDYFFNVMVYEMDDFVLEGLRTFQSLLLKHGDSDCTSFPHLVRPGPP
ncbi:MAG: menaquinone biosynthetic enzyme MqnA/MqnD family protein [Fimbriimonas sp.]